LYNTCTENKYLPRLLLLTRCLPLCSRAIQGSSQDAQDEPSASYSRSASQITMLSPFPAHSMARLCSDHAHPARAAHVDNLAVDRRERLPLLSPHITGHPAPLWESIAVCRSWPPFHHRRSRKDQYIRLLSKRLLGTAKNMRSRSATSDAFWVTQQRPLSSCLRTGR